MCTFGAVWRVKRHFSGFETTIKGRFEKFFWAKLGGEKAVPRIGARPEESVFIHHHQSNGWGWIVDVQCSARRNQCHQLGGSVVIPDVQGNRNPVLSRAAAQDGALCHP